MAAIARDAASVILLRGDPSASGIEVLMVRRHARSDFAADMHVFPGGGVEESDCDEDLAALCMGLDPQGAMAIIGDAPSPQRALGMFIAGIRETFEEAGILLACEPSGELIAYEGERSERFSDLREELREERTSFKEMVAGEGLALAAGRLVYFAHWITPELSPIRFDTRFFLAPAPPRQNALHDNVETTDHLWIAPRDALERNEGGTLAMLPPTVINLMVLARFSSVEEALACAEGGDVPAILPKVTFEEGKVGLVLPEDPEDP